MSGHDREEAESRIYAIRLQERAVRDITAAYVRMEELVSLKVADDWRDGLKIAIAGLATNPRRFSPVPERFHREVRHLLYRRRGSRAAHRVLYTISSEEHQAPEPPTVTILHVRHAAMRPISRAQARQIESLE